MNLFKDDLPSRNPCSLGLGEDLEVRSDLGGARSQRLWHTFALNEAHSAVASHGQPLVVAEARDLHARLSARLIDGVRAIDFHGFAVDVDIEPVRQALRWPEDYRNNNCRSGFAFLNKGKNVWSDEGGRLTYISCSG